MLVGDSMLIKRRRLQSINSPVTAADRFISTVNRAMVRAASEGRTWCTVYVTDNEHEHIEVLLRLLASDGYDYQVLDETRVLIKW